MTDHQPPPAVELPINDPTNPAHRLADDLRRGRIPGYAAEDVRAVLESLRHSVEREAGLREAGSKAYRACMSAWAAGEPAHRVADMLNAVDALGTALGEPGARPARAALDRRAGT